jgi:hypothetical protein
MIVFKFFASCTKGNGNEGEREGDVIYHELNEFLTSSSISSIL